MKIADLLSPRQDPQTLRTPLVLSADRATQAERQVDNLVKFGLIESTSGYSQPKKNRDNRQLNRSASVLARQISNRETHQPVRVRQPLTDRGPVPSRPRLPDNPSVAMPAVPVRAGRERTYIGIQCATCEEPLEHTLRGERILQLTCGHVSHEACFYEYIREFAAHTCPSCDAPLALDPKRGGNVDFQNLSKFVESSQAPGPLQERINDLRSGTPAQWDHSIRKTIEVHQDDLKPHHGLPDRTRRSHSERDLPTPHMSMAPSHSRNESAETGRASTFYQSEVGSAAFRKHDSDFYSGETPVNSTRKSTWMPIPAPALTIRSEFPNITKSRQQQSLTCLVTVEVPTRKLPSLPNFVRESIETPRKVESIRVDPSPTASRKRPHPTSRQGSHTASEHTITRPVDSVHEDTAANDLIKEDLHRRVDNWHGLDFARFGNLALHGMIRVAKDGQSWQILECFLFKEMLICVKEKKNSPGDGARNRCTLKGSILIKKHLKSIGARDDTYTLTLTLSVTELPQFHLQFLERSQMEVWKGALLEIQRGELEPLLDDRDLSTSDDDDYQTTTPSLQRTNSIPSTTRDGTRSQVTAPTDYTHSHSDRNDAIEPFERTHVPIDVVVVVPVSSSMQGLKIDLLRDALLFLVANMGERDRMGLVTFGSSSGGVPLVGMTNKEWGGWSKAIDSIRPLGQKNMRADVIEGANVAVDLLMQRRSRNPLSSILLISDAASVDQEIVDFVISRAEAAKITIHSFGLGTTHKPDSMVEISSRTKASYTYVKDWMLLRECLAGAMGCLQSTSHQNVKLKLKLPEGSPAKFVKISGALQITKRATGRDAEVILGDLRFGDKRDILVQLAIPPDSSTPSVVPSDAWDNVIAGLEALGGSSSDHGDSRPMSIEELPLVQATLSWGDLIRNGTVASLPQPRLLTITVLPTAKKNSHLSTLPIPPLPAVVQRRMELLTSDMLSRALILTGRGQHDRASHLLSETRSILKGLGKGGLPPLPPPSAALPPTPSQPTTPRAPEHSSAAAQTNGEPAVVPEQPNLPTPPQPRHDIRAAPDAVHWALGIDKDIMDALDVELASGREWMAHPAVFGRDSRKAVLQAIGVISTQRGLTFRTPAESLWASRIPGIKRLTDLSREWRDASDNSLAEET